MKITSFALSCLLFLSIPSSSFAQLQVDKFTGDLSYSLPLLSVPAPNGPPVPATLVYHSGIAVEQQASEVGLGWQLMLGGSIRRHVSGIPDDCDGKMLLNDDAFTGTLFPNGSNGFSANNGLLYFNNEMPTSDIYRHYFKMDTLFWMGVLPDYDQYFVSGPGISGEMQPHLWRYADLGTNYSTPVNKVNFSFKHDFADTLQHRYFPWEGSPLSGDTNNFVTVYFPGDDVGSPASDLSYEGGAFNDESHYIVSNRDRLRTAKYVEYFTNQQIESYKASPGQYPIEGGFIEYGSSVTRNTTDDGSLIGAFRITNESGYTFHYSLPVYVNATTTAGYDLNHDYTERDYITNKDSTQIPGAGGSYMVKDTKGDTISFNDAPMKYREVARYAIEWLLTGITGPDFEDDGDGYLDDGDKGYWVLFDYTKQHENHTLRTPFKGYSYAFSSQSYEVPEMVGGGLVEEGEMHVQEEGEYSGRLATFDLTEMQHYYLNSVLTPTHELEIGVADRLDEQTKRDTSFRLYERENNTLLREVRLKQDYRLAPGYYRNSNVSLSNTGDFDSPVEVAAGASFSRNTLSGKLTLNEVEMFGVSGEKVQPDYHFGYDHTSLSANPNYNPLKTDYRGFYKSDTDGNGLKGYRSSSTDPTAWSLRYLVSPQGDSIAIEYESDEYEYVINESHYGGNRGTSRTFAIQDADTVPGSEGHDWTFELESGRDELTELLTAIGDNNGLLKARVTAMIPVVNVDSSSSIPCTQFLGGEVFREYRRSYYDKLLDMDKIDLGSPDMLTEMNIETDAFAIPPDGDTASADCKMRLYYLGNGYIRFEFDEGWKLLGGGIRVKEMVTYNGNNEAYTVALDYYGGVATEESDPYGFITLPSHNKYDHSLSNKKHSKYQLNPQVGYKRVTEENKGQNDLALGRNEYIFHTDCGVNGPGVMDQEIKGVPYYQPYSTTWIDWADETGDLCIEVIDQFTTFWGSQAAELVYDKQNLLIRKTEYEYEHPVAGAEVEAFLYSYEAGFDTYDPVQDLESYYNRHLGGFPFHFPKASVNDGGHIINNFLIFREYPTRVKSVSTYSNGIETTIYNEQRDPLTAEVTVATSVSTNETEEITLSQAAYHQPAYRNMGPKSDNWLFANLLTAPYEGKAYRDTNLTHTQDFAEMNKVLWTTNARVRAYDPALKHYRSASQTVPWYSNRSYSWRGPLGIYGIFKGSELKDFHPSINMNMSWNGFDLATFYKYTATPWIGTSADGGTALNGTELQNIFLFEKDYYDTEYTEGSLESGKFLYDADDLMKDFPTAASNNGWIGGELGALYTDHTTIYPLTGTAISADWRFQARVTLLDGRNNVLENIDENGRYHAERYCFDNTIAYAAVSNANFSSFTATGFEEVIVEGDSTFVEGEVNIFTNTRVNDSAAAHTGNYYLQMAAGSGITHRITGFDEFQSDKTYRASVWVHESTDPNAFIQVKAVTTGTPLNVTMQRDDADTIRTGDWILLNMDVDIPDDNDISEIVLSFHTTGSGGAKIDDLRFHCIDAPMEVMVYDRSRGRIMAELDNNNYATRYNYDAQGRIIEVWQDIPGVGNRLVKKSEHHFARKY